MIDGLIRISKAGIWFSISGMLTVAFIYCVWGLGEDIYCEVNDCTEEVVDWQTRRIIEVRYICSKYAVMDFSILCEI